MKKLINISILLLLTLPLALNAQSYIMSGGLRLGSGHTGRQVGLTFQQRFAKHYTLEEIIQTDFSRNTTVHIIGKKHIPIVTRRLNVYGGAGVSFGSEQSTQRVGNETIIATGNPTAGVDLIAGAELTLAKVNVSVDYKPNFNVAGGRNPWASGQVALSARTVLVKGNFFRKLKRKRNRKQRQRARERERKRKERNGEGIDWPDWWPEKKDKK